MPLKPPKLSLCIPTYNRSALLRDALETILAQWEEAFNDQVELIVSDNASTDDTPQALEQIVQAHPLILWRTFRMPENRGPDANIFQAFQMAQGEFAYLLSDDDLLLPGAISNLLALIQAHPTFDAFCLNVRSFLESPSEEGPVWFPTQKDRVLCDRDEALVLLKPLFMSVFAFRRSLAAGQDYSATIGTNLLQSYLFLDVMAHGQGILVTAQPFLAQRRGNTGGWNFFRVMTTNLRDWLTRAEEKGFSKKATSRLLSEHLRTLLLTSVLCFKLSGGRDKLAPERSAYRDGMQRLWHVYGPHPFLLFVLYPLMLTPDILLQRLRDLYHVVRPGRAMPQGSR